MTVHTAQPSLLEEYVIDTNVFLNFWVLNEDEPFGKDVHASAWQYLETQIALGRIIAPAHVKVELEKHGSTELKQWVASHGGMFVSLDDSTLQPLSQIVKMHKAYKKAQSSQADAVIVALAKCRNLTVITSEKHEPAGNRSTSNPKIPNVCEDMGVKWVSATGFFRLEGQHF